MGIKKNSIAVLCDYSLMPERIGGMDYFFWQFDASCKAQNIGVDWFFPNKEMHGEYGNLNIIPAEGKSIENLFLDYVQKNKIHYTHVITHFLEICTPFYKNVKKILLAKIIAVDHNPRPLSGYSIKKKIVKRIKGRLYSKYIDLFIGVSQYTVDELIRDFGKHIKPKCQVIYNGIVLENIKERTIRNTNNPTLLVASHLRESKGIQDLIAAVALLPSNLKENLTIDVYGEGPYEKQLLEQLKDMRVEENFNFKGSSPNLSETFYKYDYLLHPTHMECFSLTILESLAANVPVITTPVGGNLEVVSNSENGFIFNAKEIDELKNLIIGLINGNKQIIGNTRTLIANNFSLQNMVEQHLKLLK
ncbi:glycosyltransferase family 4 protein [Aequorivita sp. F47161]|uniref:Glycosyltransferase family 4 protein n=1 Tax=Aequorivita vitellina TaxID=2874475 RepID=A0A9X1QY34_9FLAO|nr:glycosyltransferase family 4 protein [Aequorivita vitellina]MCG2419889.1 glycosyltransferase family 4 protein [Aequorivita vitellina]